MRTRSPSSVYFPPATQAVVEPPDWVLIPDSLAEGGDARRAEGRLHHSLLAVAGSPERALEAAALHASASSLDFARASAELAVTGHRAWTAFSALDPPGNPNDLVERIARRPAVEGMLGPAGARATVGRYVEWARWTSRWLRAETRTERDAALRALHPALPGAPTPRPWVAVSGELDPPDRPVNTARHHFRQRDVRVAVSALTVRVRVAWSDNVADPRTKTVLFLHGLGSSLEETQAVCARLEAKGYGFVSVDLPNQGYSERLGFLSAGISDIHRTGSRDAAGQYVVRAMTFYLDFLEAFIRRLPQEFPGASPTLSAVAGGSQGGCLLLGLALRQRQRGPGAPRLIERFLSWSIGSCWRSYLDGDSAHQLALTLGPLREAVASEHDGARAAFLRGMFDRPIPVVNKVQPDLWFSASWAGRRQATLAARALRWEVYDEWHRRWCSAMAHEQLAYSFAGEDLFAPRGRWPLDGLEDPLLLIAGQVDDYPFTNICSATGVLAQRASDPALGTLARPQGFHVTFPDSGHSLADERPMELAEELDAFLKDTGPFP